MAAKRSKKRAKKSSKKKVFGTPGFTGRSPAGNVKLQNALGANAKKILSKIKALVDDDSWQD